MQLKSIQPLRGNRAELANLDNEINKLKPEIINDNNMSFPDLKKKEGELLWKETL